MNKKFIKELKKEFTDKKEQIAERLRFFKSNFLSDKKIFYEFIFCLLTPQSRAKMCWQCVENLKKKGKLRKGNKNDIICELNNVRFKYTKAENIILAEKKFKEVLFMVKKEKNVFALRDWLVKNIRGYGYKEASHFLRNIGFIKDIAILDRHILKNLKKAGVIRYIPETLTKKKYFEIENKMKKFAKKIKIPIGALDLLLWSKETGEIFK